MQRIIAIIITIVLINSTLGCSVDSINNRNYDISRINSEFIQGNNRFAFKIFRELNKEDIDKNIFISPFSISTALSMTYQGARGSTKEAMEEALSYKGIDIHILNEGYVNLLKYLSMDNEMVELDINNSIWIKEGQEIKKEFIDVNKDIFNSYIEEIDFSDEGATDTINKWIKDSTKGKIKRMLQPPIPPQVIMYLINAIYFKGQWTVEFDEKNTFTSEFHKEDGKIEEIDMMSKKGETEYGIGDDFKVIRLPYGNGEIAMYSILPNEDISIEDFIDKMDLSKWREIKESISKADNVIVQIPRFRMEYGVKNLNDSLTYLGMGEIFTDRADFSGIRENVAISRVLHKAVIEVNEKGSEAAAATVVEVAETAAMEPASFIANRPFVFIIADDKLDTILFMGKVKSIED